MMIQSWCGLNSRASKLGPDPIVPELSDAGTDTSSSIGDANMQFDSKLLESIAEEIHCDTSPVGIDARKTHVLIIATLRVMEERLTKMEATINEMSIKVESLFTNQ
jgi:hypothetical protein